MHACWDGRNWLDDAWSSQERNHASPLPTFLSSNVARKSGLGFGKRINPSQAFTLDSKSGYQKRCARCLSMTATCGVARPLRAQDCARQSVASRPRFGGDSQAHSWYRPAGKVQLDRDQLYRTRQVLGRAGFLMSRSIRSLPR